MVSLPDLTIAQHTELEPIFCDRVDGKLILLDNGMSSAG